MPSAAPRCVVYYRAASPPTGEQGQLDPLLSVGMRCYTRNPALVPGIHVLLRAGEKDVDGRDKPGHDENAHLRALKDQRPSPFETVAPRPPVDNGMAVMRG